MICATKSKFQQPSIQFGIGQVGIGLIAALLLFALLALVPSPVSAQQNTTITGDYAGTLGPLHIRLHLKQNAAGVVSGTLDSPDQGAMGIHCADFEIDGQSVTFSIPAVQAIWRGTIAADGTLTGSWVQGRSLTLNFIRDSTVPGGAGKMLRAAR